MNYQVTPADLVFYCGSTLLEGPCWDEKQRVVYCVSIDEHEVYRIDPFNGLARSYPTDGPVGCVVIEESGMILTAEKTGIHRINPETGQREFLIQLEPDPLMRYNDGKFDPRGRFLVGTKGLDEDYEGRGCVFAWDGTESRRLIEGTTISNGIGFTSDNQRMFFIDTPTKKVGAYKYNIETGEAEFDAYIVEIEGPGYPDGMCVDLDGMIWVAEWEGGQLCKWNPDTGEKLATITMPCRRVTSCCLGGDDLDLLFMTTAHDDTAGDLLGGGLFKLKIR
ncbi:MAG: SMP-30/gluconolactonase/LRE family protein [Planctomycetota bacterium]